MNISENLPFAPRTFFPCQRQCVCFESETEKCFRYLTLAFTSEKARFTALEHTDSAGSGKNLKKCLFSVD